MVDRVLIGQYAPNDFRLRISRPGFDVNNTSLTPAQLAFDSTYEETFYVIAKGEFLIGRNYGTPGASNLRTVTVPYGVTYPEIPIVMAYGKLFGNWGNDTEIWTAGWAPLGETYSTMQRQQTRLNVYRDRFEVRCFSNLQDTYTQVKWFLLRNTYR